jgi:hypothetical protein
VPPSHTSCVEFVRGEHLAPVPRPAGFVKPGKVGPGCLRWSSSIYKTAPGAPHLTSMRAKRTRRWHISKSTSGGTFAVAIMDGRRDGSINISDVLLVTSGKGGGEREIEIEKEKFY